MRSRPAGFASQGRLRGVDDRPEGLAFGMGNDTGSPQEDKCDAPPPWGSLTVTPTSHTGKNFPAQLLGGCVGSWMQPRGCKPSRLQVLHLRAKRVQVLPSVGARSLVTGDRQECLARREEVQRTQKPGLGAGLPSTCTAFLSLPPPRAARCSPCLPALLAPARSRPGQVGRSGPTA